MPLPTLAESQLETSFIQISKLFPSQMSFKSIDVRRIRVEITELHQHFLYPFAGLFVIHMFSLSANMLHHKYNFKC